MVGCIRAYIMGQLAFCASVFKRETIIIMLLVLIAGELVTTIWLVPFSATAIWVTTAAVLVCAGLFYAMIRYRLRMSGEHSPEKEFA